MDDLFKAHHLTVGGVEKVNRVRETFDQCLQQLQKDMTGSGRYESMVKTKLEEACMLAVKAIAVQPANQERPEDMVGQQ